MFETILPVMFKILVLVGGFVVLCVLSKIVALICPEWDAEEQSFLLDMKFQDMALKSYEEKERAEANHDKTERGNADNED